MADALCGPSNALQSFQKHSSLDRSLQQDRYNATRNHQQGFRSAPGPNAAVLDAEFEAFQASRPVHAQQGFFEQNPSYDFPMDASIQQPQYPDWVSDFQDLRLKETPLIAPVMHRDQIVPSQLDTARTQHQDPMDNSDPKSRIIQGFHGPGTRFYQPPMVHGNLGLPQSWQHQHSQMPAHRMQAKDSGDVFSDEIFEKGFREAAQGYEQSAGEAEADVKTWLGSENEMRHDATQLDLAGQQGQTQMENIRRNKVLLRESLSPQTRDEAVPYTAGEHAHLDTEDRSEEHVKEADDDELARTAGNLLKNVEHDHSRKFKESSFLSLMRQLRDRDVKVQGDKIVGVSKPLTPL